MRLNWAHTPSCNRAWLAGLDCYPDGPLAIESLDVVVHTESGGTAVMLERERAAAALQVGE